MNNDTQKKMSAWTKFLIVSAVFAAIWLLTILVFLFIYAYKNPDPRSCWVADNIDTAELTKENIIQRAAAMDVQLGEGFPVDMHTVYTSWFFWGFWAHVVFAGSIMGSFVVMEWNPYAFKLIVISFCSIFALNQTIWLFIGYTARFSKIGQVASGELLEKPIETTNQKWALQLQASANAYGYQFKSALFMKVYCLIMTVVASLSIIIFMVGTLIFCLCNPLKSKDEPEIYQRLDGEDYEEAAGDKGEQQDDDEGLFGKGK